MFVPLGAFVRHFTSRGVVVGTVLGMTAGFLSSLLVEVTQLSGVWGLSSCAYRLFDVDDLLANTAGALLGALVAPVLLLVPGQRRVESQRVQPVTVALGTVSALQLGHP